MFPSSSPICRLAAPPPLFKSDDLSSYEVCLQCDFQVQQLWWGFFSSVSECKLVLYKCDINSDSLGCYVIYFSDRFQSLFVLQYFVHCCFGGSKGDGEAEIVTTIFAIDADTVYAFHVNNYSLDAFGSCVFRSTLMTHVVENILGWEFQKKSNVVAIYFDQDD